MAGPTAMAMAMYFLFGLRLPLLWLVLVVLRVVALAGVLAPLAQFGGGDQTELQPTNLFSNVTTFVCWAWWWPTMKSTKHGRNTARVCNVRSCRDLRFDCSKLWCHVCPCVFVCMVEWLRRV